MRNRFFLACRHTGQRWYVGGGFAGTIVEQAVSVTPGDSITVVVGAGGAWKFSAGGQSSFGAVTASGGALGNASAFYGNGEARVTSYGTAYNGRHTYYSANYYGGQAGFGNGGDGRGYPGGSLHGQKGGGGGAGVDASPGTDGGDGVVKISWGA